MTYYTYVQSPVGRLLLVATGAGVTGIWFGDTKRLPEIGADWREGDAHPLLRRTAKQLQEYFAGRRRTFDLPLAPAGTPFQQRVWKALRGIPYGRTCSYGEIARRIGRPRAVRAVGAANGANPLSVVVPCHRVIGADGSLTGYGGGIARKRALLELESAGR